MVCIPTFGPLYICLHGLDRDKLSIFINIYLIFAFIVCVHMYIVISYLSHLFFFLWRCGPTRAMASYS